MSFPITFFAVLLTVLAFFGGAESLYISGLQGQQFQFEGVPNRDFNIISTPNLQINAHFSYIERASQACNYTETACFSHAGTYIDGLGLTINSMPHVTKLRLLAGSHQQGITLFAQQGKTEQEISLHKRMLLTTPDTYHVSVFQTSKSQIVINSLFFKMTISNSDHFFNVAIAMHDDNLMKHGATRLIMCGGDGSGLDGIGMIGGPSYPQVPIHGIIGQTFKNALYCGGRMYEGEWDDYEVNDLYSTDFRYNQFVTEKNY